MNSTAQLPVPLPVRDRWCVTAYYTVCPEAPDGSGRLLVAGADLERGTGEVIILDRDGKILDRFGEAPVGASFFHTGLWQSWSPDARAVYFQTGTLTHPRMARFDLQSRKLITLDGDMEGAPPDGEPIISTLHDMLYAAGYGDGIYSPQNAPVPFGERDRHGIFEHRLDPAHSVLRVTTEQILQQHPQRDRLTSPNDFTLMTYCVRWSPTGERLLFYFGNHCVAKSRGEPRISYVMTSDRSLKDIRLALDLSFGKRGVHWSWQPDGEHLIGYGPHPDDRTRLCLAEVRYDGTGYRWISDHATSGHPSVSPLDRNLIVTDAYAPDAVIDFIDRRTGKVIERIPLPAVRDKSTSHGRHPGRIDLHPVFSRDGRSVYCNAMIDGLGTLHRLAAPTLE